MKIPIDKLIEGMIIEDHDVGYFFWQYIQQNGNNPHATTFLMFNKMDDVLQEEFGLTLESAMELWMAGGKIQKVTR